MRKTFLALAPVGALTLAAVLAVPSGPALACGPNSYLGSVCYTAATFCPAGMRQLSTPNAVIPLYQGQALYAIFGNLYGGSSTGNVTIGLPNLSGRTLAGAGTGVNPPLSPAKLAAYRGTDIPQALTYAQMPAHSHNATFNVTFPGGAPSLTWQAASAGAASSSPSATNTFVAGLTPATANMWAANLTNPVTLQGTSVAVSGGFASGAVTNTAAGTGKTVDTRPPGVVVTACMPVDGYSYPPRP